MAWKTTGGYSYTKKELHALFPSRDKHSAKYYYHPYTLAVGQALMAAGKIKTVVASLFSVFHLLILLPVVTTSAAYAMIKVLILDDHHTTVPDMNEDLVRLGNITGKLLANGTYYSGNLEVWKGTNGLYIINELPLESYIENVVVTEIGANWELEAIKAQAVISRTYAVNKKNSSANPKFHITSSVLHQAYKGNNTQIQIAYAVKQTEGEILTYNGKPIEAFYHSTCGGKTEDPAEVFGKSLPYLKPVEAVCSLSPYAAWERKIPFPEIEKALDIIGIKDITVSEFTPSGRVKHLSVEHGSGQTVIKSTELRKLLGWNRLPSTNFTLHKNDSLVTFEGSGYGHGVGLCQWSALQMARDGKNYKEILSYFYPGTEIKLYEGD